MFSSSKQRTTWAMASFSRMLARNLCHGGAAPAAECSAAALATSRCRGHGVLLLDRVLGEIGAYSQAIGLHFQYEFSSGAIAAMKTIKEECENNEHQVFGIGGRVMIESYILGFEFGIGG